MVRLQNIDRRILYVLIAVILAVPIIIRPGKHPDVIFPEVRNTYDVIDHVPPGKIVLLSNSWGAGTLSENKPQMQALMRHMFQKHIKFAVFSWDPAGSEITMDAATEVQKAMHAKYGVDWAHLGYRVGATQAIISGIGQDFQGFMKQDKFGTPLSKLPSVGFVKDYKQIGAVVDITSTGLIDYWIAYLTTPKHIPLIFAPTAVMSASAYSYLDSGQLKGMLNGVMGAVQYETLVGQKNEKTDASAISWALSCAHIYILLLILLGNLGYVFARRSGLERGGTR